MAVPLFDTATPLAPLRQTILERIAEVVAAGRFVLGPEVQAFEQEFADYLGVRHVDRRRQRHRRDHDRAARARRQARRRRGRPVAHLLRHRRGGRQRRRAAGVLRRRPRHAQRHRRHRPRGADPARPRRSSPSTCSACRRRSRAARRWACPCSRTRPRRPARASTAPWPARSATPPRSPSTPPRTSAPSATAARSPPTTTRSPSAGPGAALPRLAGQADVRATSATTRAWTSSRRRSCASCCPSSTAGATAAGPAPRPTVDAGLGEHVALPVVPEGAIPAWHLYVVTHPRADELLARAQRRRRSGPRLLPRAAAPPAGDGAVRAATRPQLPGRPTSWPPTNIALPISPVLTAGAGRRGRGGARRGGLTLRRSVGPVTCASGSTSPTRRTCWCCGR